MQVNVYLRKKRNEISKSNGGGGGQRPFGLFSKKHPNLSRLSPLSWVSSGAIYSKAKKSVCCQPRKKVKNLIFCRLNTSAGSRAATSLALTASQMSKSSPSSCTWMWTLSSTAAGTYVEHITPLQNLPCSLTFHPVLNLWQYLLPTVPPCLRPRDMEAGAQAGWRLHQGDAAEAGHLLHQGQRLPWDAVWGAESGS